MPDLAAGPRAFAVDVQFRVGLASTSAAGGTEPMKLYIAEWPTASQRPSGSPHTARRWFSNWLVIAPSIVQCPELWTRGAISFASSRGPSWNHSIVSTPT